MSSLTKQHFEQLAAGVRALTTQKERRSLAFTLLPMLKASNERFATARFLAACGVDDTGPGAAPASPSPAQLEGEAGTAELARQNLVLKQERDAALAQLSARSGETREVVGSLAKQVAALEAENKELRAKLADYSSAYADYGVT